LPQTAFAVLRCEIFLVLLMGINLFMYNLHDNETRSTVLKRYSTRVCAVDIVHNKLSYL